MISKTRRIRNQAEKIKFKSKTKTGGGPLIAAIDRHRVYAAENPELVTSSVNSIWSGWDSAVTKETIRRFLASAGMMAKDHADRRKRLILLLRGVFQLLGDWHEYARDHGVPGAALWFPNPTNWDLCNFYNPMKVIASARVLTDKKSIWVAFKLQPPRFVGFPHALEKLEQPPAWRVLEPLLHNMGLKDERNSEGLPFRVALYRKEKGALSSKTEQWKQFLEMLKNNSTVANSYLWIPKEFVEKLEHKKARETLIKNLASFIPLEEPTLPGVFSMVWSEVFGSQVPIFELPEYDDPRKLAWDPAYDHQLGLPEQLDSGPIFDEKKPSENPTKCWVGKCEAQVEDWLPVCEMHTHIIEMAMDRRTGSTMVPSFSNPEKYVVATERIKGRRMWRNTHPAVRAAIYREFLAMKTLQNPVPTKTPMALLRAAAIRSHSGAKLDWQSTAAQDQHRCSEKVPLK
jgi:hypothetical protein